MGSKEQSKSNSLAEKMSLARAFTTRRGKPSVDMGLKPQRSIILKSAASSNAIRSKISGPMELIHTTNMLSYNAPDLFPKTNSPTGSSTKSDEELSDAPTHTSSPPTSPDVPSVSGRTASPEPNHLSCYFTPPGQTPASTVKAEPPVIPKRAPSHTKKSYNGLSRQPSVSQLSEKSHRTVSTKASFSFSRTSSSSTSTSMTQNSTISQPQQAPKVSGAPISSPLPLSTAQPSPPVAPQPKKDVVSPRRDATPAQHPFGHELAQVSEIAEEYGVRDRLNTLDAEEQELAAKGLFKIRPEEYLREIDLLFPSYFNDATPGPAAVWI